MYNFSTHSPDEGYLGTSKSWLLWIPLQWTWCIYSSESAFCVHLDIFPRVRLLGPKALKPFVSARSSVKHFACACQSGFRVGIRNCSRLAVRWAKAAARSQQPAGGLRSAPPTLESHDGACKGEPAYFAVLSCCLRQHSGPCLSQGHHSGVSVPP